MKKSVILFILANLAVMSIPVWIALPLNTKIASGKWRSVSKEEEAKLSRIKFDGITALEIASDSQNIGLAVNLSDHEELVMDTAFKNFVSIQVVGQKLKIHFDQQKYKAWVYKGGTTSVIDNPYADEVSNLPEISLMLHLKKLTSVKAFNTNIRLETFPGYEISAPLEAILDSSDLRLSYEEYSKEPVYVDEDEDAVHNVTADLKYPIKVWEKNGSGLTFSYLKNIDLNLMLENDFYTVDSPMHQTYKNLVINYDDSSDITLNVSDLHKVKLVKMK